MITQIERQEEKVHLKFNTSKFVKVVLLVCLFVCLSVVDSNSSFSFCLRLSKQDNWNNISGAFNYLRLAELLLISGQ